MDEPATGTPTVNGISGRTIVLLAVLIFIGQIGVLAWLGSGELPAKKIVTAPGLKLMPEILLVPDHGIGAPFSDPMLFARPNRRAAVLCVPRHLPSNEGVRLR